MNITEDFEHFLLEHINDKEGDATPAMEITCYGGADLPTTTGVIPDGN